MFDKDKEQILIARMDGWVFKEGNDTAWAKKDIDVTNWKKLKPSDLSAEYADKNGRAECWFRIKIKSDSTFKTDQFGFKISTWGALDLYVDGELISSCGNTGNNASPFVPAGPQEKLSVPFIIKPENEYSIAFHLVDYVAPFMPRRLKSEDYGLSRLIKVTGPSYNIIHSKDILRLYIYGTIWASVCAVLSLLFWLIYIQNPLEKNLRLIAFGATFSTFTNFFNTIEDNADISFNEHLVYSYAANLAVDLSCILTLLIIVHIFKRKVSAALKIFLVIFFTGIIVSGFVPSATGAILSISLLALLFVVCIYYIISSWKKLKGSQWAVVAGLLLSLAFAILYIFTSVPIILNESAFYFSVTGYSLSFPLSLLVYVSIRFKEIIKEVQLNAKQVVQLSEEKKEQALNQQKVLQDEVNRQTKEIRATLDNLTTTQSQLIQSEKMASLGELTAGIAHEIQNPLNFVNNFSEVNKELLEELKAERLKPNEERNEHEENETINDVIANSEKINYHGKRADAIVKGMLQHSRSSTGAKEPTDINTLADEYLRLAYHGFRAKDKKFNATMTTEYDENIGNINIIPQDIGRVILNLITNAFYAVAEKKKQADENYEPTVFVSTKKINNSIQIKVDDNGNGIPQKNLEKIFQPFFTTKPTGQGTGLGLSLSYDIIKAHNGEIKVKTRENQGTTFIIHLPF